METRKANLLYDLLQEATASLEARLMAEGPSAEQVEALAAAYLLTDYIAPYTDDAEP